MKKIVHLTSVHKRYDIRIFLKQCVSLASVGYDVYLVVADGLGDEIKDGVKIIDVGSYETGRVGRILNTTKRIYSKALALRADLYHFHDPELLSTGIKLKKNNNSKVIFDSHEDYVSDILSKPYLNFLTKNTISFLYKHYEKYACKKIDYTIAATPSIRNKFISLGVKSVDINNYPLLSEINELIIWDNPRKNICYMGAMTPIRGLFELIEAMQYVNPPAKIEIAGIFSDVNIEKLCRSSLGWNKVIDHGYVSRLKVSEILSGCAAGLVTYLPAPNHIDSQPNKLFEYMASGIPVIGSDFPLWEKIIVGNNCGICVDPSNSIEIAEAINYLLNNQVEAKSMGKNGRTAILEKYNWSFEVKKLLSTYSELGI